MHLQLFAKYSQLFAKYLQLFAKYLQLQDYLKIFHWTFFKECIYIIIIIISFSKLLCQIPVNDC